MLKIRLMGTKNDIKWFQKILQRNTKVEVTEFSELYTNKGRGTPEAERDYDEIFERLPEEQQQTFVDKKAYFKSLCR